MGDWEFTKEDFGHDPRWGGQTNDISASKAADIANARLAEERAKMPVVFGGRFVHRDKSRTEFWKFQEDYEEFAICTHQARLDGIRTVERE